MEIIKKGNVKNQMLPGTCLKCGCKVKFTRDEAKKVDSARNETIWSVKCPTEGCKATIYSEE